MGKLVTDLLRLAKYSKIELKLGRADLSKMAMRLGEDLSAGWAGRSVEFKVQPGIEVRGDENLLDVVLENLLGKAWKFTSKPDKARIEFGSEVEANGATAYFVRDNGAGFDLKLLRSFSRHFIACTRNMTSPAQALASPPLHA